MVICLNYGHFEKKLRSVIVSQNDYPNQILDVHPSILSRKPLEKYLKRGLERGLMPLQPTLCLLFVIPTDY